MGNTEHIRAIQPGDGDVSAQNSSMQSAVANKLRSEIDTLTPPVASNSGSFSNSYNTAKELAQGAVEEIIHHPGRLLKEAAIGVGLGTLASYPKVSLGVFLGVVATVGTQEYRKTGAIWNTARNITRWQTPDSLEEPDKQTDNKELGAEYLDTGVRVASSLLAYKILGRLGRSAGAVAAKEVSAVHSGEHVDMQAITKLTEKLRAERLAVSGELKVNTGESLFKEPVQLPSVQGGFSFTMPRQMQLPKLSDGPQFDFLKSKE